MKVARCVLGRGGGSNSFLLFDNISLPKTTSTKPNVRYFYSLIAFLIQNYWVYIKWNQFARIKQGPKVIDDDLFPLAHLLEIIYVEASKWFSLKDIDEIAIT